MTVRFYTGFNKRINSTLRPGTGATYTDINCKLKNDTSEHDPILILNSSTFNYNYAYISDWGKYYFVTDVVSVANNLIEYHLSEDVLATFKPDILNTEARVVYSTDGTGSLGSKVIDPRLQIGNQRTVTISGGASYPVFDQFQANHYLLTVINNLSNNDDISGITCSYLLNDSGMGKFRNWLNATTITAYIRDLLGDPLNSIVSLFWTPFTIDLTYLDGATEIVVCDKSTSGDITFTPGEVYRVKTSYPILNRDLYIPRNQVYTDYRSIEPYTTGTIYLPGVGVVPVTMSEWVGETQIRVNISTEILTGKMLYTLMRQSNNSIVQTIECNVAAQCPVGRITNEAAGTFTGIGAMAGGIASVITGAATESAVGVVAGVGALIAGAANTALSANTHSSSISGNYGSRYVFKNPYVQWVEYSVPMESVTVNYADLRGVPTQYHGSIGLLADGYIQCEGGSVVSSANMVEKQEINDFLNGGFYKE